MQKLNLFPTPEEALSSEEIRAPEDWQRVQEKTKRLANTGHFYMDVWNAGLI